MLDSQALGTPVLANRIGGIPELIAEGQTGMLMDVFTPEHYAARIRALYQDPEGVARMSENCRRQSGADTLESYCDKLLNIYEHVLEAERIG